MPFTHFLTLIVVVIIAGGATVWLAVAMGGQAALVTMLPIALGLSLWLRRVAARAGKSDE